MKTADPHHRDQPLDNKLIVAPIAPTTAKPIEAIIGKTFDEIEVMIDQTDKADIKTSFIINGAIKESPLMNAQISYLHKKIKEKFGTNIGDLKADLTNRDDKLSQEEIASTTIDVIREKNIIYTNETFYLWDSSGVWKQANDKLIKKEIHTVHRNYNIEIISGQVEAICNLIKTETFRPDHKFNIGKNRINCLSGELEFHDGEFRQKPHYRENYNTSQIPVEFYDEAGAPLFLNFLCEIFADESPEVLSNKINLVLELIGYSLTSSCEYEKFVILIGNGANGKSVLLSVIEALVGVANIAAVQPSQFNNRFQRAHLDGKLVNIVTEIAEGAVIADAELKAIVSGELTTAEHKGRDPFNFHPYATCWFGTNHMPHTRDFSDALQRRAEIIEFPHTFKGKSCDPKLKDKLLTELKGIMALAIISFGQACDRGEFTKCIQSEAAKLRWRKETDQVVQFVEDCCMERFDTQDSIANLYSRYRMWAVSSGIKNTLGQNKFSERLVRLGFVRGRGTGGVRIFKGIAIDAGKHFQ